MTLVLKRITVYDIPPYTLREADRMECLAAGIEPDVALKRSVQASNNAFAHYWNDELLCMWGFRYEDKRGDSAFMWLLSTPAVDLHAMAFARASKRLLAILLGEAEVIKVLVHNQHSVAVRWLSWLGFTQVEDFNENFMLMRKVR